jgi:hypothetical protein
MLSAGNDYMAWSMVLNGYWSVAQYYAADLLEKNGEGYKITRAYLNFMAGHTRQEFADNMRYNARSVLGIEDSR